MSSEQKVKGTLRDRRAVTDAGARRQKLMKEIIDDYKDNGKFHVAQAENKNIMFIGRTRTGKSTIKSLLKNPTVVPDELTLKSGTKDPLFETFYVLDNQMVLNIIDTPGLFEHGTADLSPRDNETILKTIEICANREITKFHVICFCVAITTGINQEDIESLKLLKAFLGDEISNNSCLIITRCEAKDQDQRDTMVRELKNDNYFSEIAPFFKLGIFFSGCLDPDDHKQGNENLLDQFIVISEYREKLIALFTNSDLEPFPLSEMLISQIRKARSHDALRQAELEKLKIENEKYAALVTSLQNTHLDDERKAKELIDKHIRANDRQTRENEHPPKVQTTKRPCGVS